MMRNWKLKLVVPAFAFAACMVLGTAQVATATFICAGPGTYACKGPNPPTPGAPNGVCQQGEGCDDGNTVNGDGCDTNCMPSGCGNGVTVFPEECDGGASADDKSGTANPPGNPCDTHCLSKNCGNHRIEGGEVCDDGNKFDNDGCDTDPANPPLGGQGLCLGSGCGNGITNMNEMMAGGCDDGNTVDNDACSNACVSAFCGDGISNNAPNETCDDGNTINNDHCTNPGVGGCVSTRCGDGTIVGQEAVEQCDDANTVNTDACRNNCTTSRCGDSISDIGEVCDDGNTLDTDNCVADPATPNAHCTKVPVCGDGITDGNEQCDNGACTCKAPKKASDGKPCVTADQIFACETADGGSCLNTGVGPNAGLACGVTAGDGNTDLPNACRDTCDSASCGDGITDTLTENCDDGFIGTAPSPADDTDSCPNGTMMVAMGMECNGTNTCGDGNPNFGHPGQPGYDPNACDNGQGTNPKTCAGMPSVACSVNTDCAGSTGPCGNSNTAVNACHDSTYSDTDCPFAGGCACEPDFCGDGVTNKGETCDDGMTQAADCNPAKQTCNTVAGDDICGSTCALATCGDGVTEAGETCDNGMPANGTPGNGGPGNVDCTSKCAFNTCGDGEALDDGNTSTPIEECDDGNVSNLDACLTTCKNAFCGDGTTATYPAGSGQINEQCDDGLTNADELDALDGCSTHCCYEPTVALQTLEGMLQSQECNLDHLAQEISALPVNRTSNRLKRHIAKALKLAGQANPNGVPASSKTICTAEKRKDRVTVCEQRAIDLGLVRGTINAQTHNELTQKILNIHGWVQNIRAKAGCF
jgi:cysteine-rich repeat protein